MVAYLKKIEGSEGYCQTMDFLNTSYIRTLDNEEMEITATIDGKVKMVTEASIRRNLKLEDSDGISNLPITEIFKQLALMGSSIRQETEVPQPSSPPHTNVADKAASTGVDVRYGGAATTVTGLEEGQGSDRVIALETNLTQTKKVYGAAFTKLIKKVKKLEKKDKISKSRRKLRLMGVSTASIDFTIDNVPVTTAGVEISTASLEVKTAEDSIDDIAAKSLVYIRRSATKTKDKAALRLQEQLDEEERVVEEELGQQSSKKQKSDELSQEELHQLMIIVSEEGMNIEALQTKYPIIDWEVFTKDSRMFNSTEPIKDKEIEIWVALKRLFEPGVDDELWKSQKHIPDITWRLYDTCGVHHVSTKDGIDIYMLVKREYLLSRGVLTQMLVAKLLVEQNNEMSGTDI
ncbi:hypothetical protein Tco_1167616 [Tanacetum coccineum]